MERNRTEVIHAILTERVRQTAKFGKQNMPLQDWILVLGEEMGELAKEFLEDNDPDNMLAEAVQVAAMAVQMYEWGYETMRYGTLWPADVIEQCLGDRRLAGGLPTQTYVCLFPCIAGAWQAYHNQGAWLDSIKELVHVSCSLVSQIMDRQRNS